MAQHLHLRQLVARRRRPGLSSSILARAGAVLTIGAAAAGIAFLQVGFPLTGCNIKGNISLNTGERIYHVPGQAYYSATRIDWLAGERWFCSEADARAAGWRRSRV